MKWQGRRTSSNLEDRRGGGGGGKLGIGAVVVVMLIGAFFGVDVTPLLQGGGSPTTTTSRPGPVEDEAGTFVGVVLAETETVWSDIFRASGGTYVEPRLVLYSGATGTGCGGADAAVGPFYCPADSTIYLDTDFFRVMSDRLGAKGEFARAYVIAHEVGHHVQALTGRLQQVSAARAQRPGAEANALSVRLELQADCYAGIWARAAAKRLALTETDIASAQNTAASIGDDALQRAATGRVVPDSFTHGSSADRKAWFTRGYRSGNPADCDSFAAR